MIGKAYTSSVFGIHTDFIEIEADVTSGIPCFDLTGNLGNTTKEAKERVKVAFRNSQIKLGPVRITVNLSPANIRKEGPYFDLPIAIAILRSMGIVENQESIFFAGELGLDGSVNPVNGILPIVICALKHGITKCVVPKENVSEVAYVQGVEIYGVENLKECILFLNGALEIPVCYDCYQVFQEPIQEDYAELKGQINLKRAIMIAASGLHNLLIIGPPGEGKTMSAARISSILPPLTFEESLQVSQVYSVAGLLGESHAYINKRPFRNPHYSITPVAFGGGGANARPGEISLSAGGVLYLDELNLFQTQTLEMLRKPLETKKITIHRQKGKCEYPADFLLVASMNPCKCGYYPDRNLCKCTEQEIRHHMGKLSKALLDRMDLCIQVKRITFEELKTNESELSSIKMKEYVERARQAQKFRYRDENFKLNSEIPPSELYKYCSIEKEAEDFMKKIFDGYHLSARSYHKILKVARTIADMEGMEKIQIDHLSEAFGYKMIQEHV